MVLSGKLPRIGDGLLRTQTWRWHQERVSAVFFSLVCSVGFLPEVSGPWASASRRLSWREPRLPGQGLPQGLRTPSTSTKCRVVPARAAVWTSA